MGLSLFLIKIFTFICKKKKKSHGINQVNLLLSFTTIFDLGKDKILNLSLSFLIYKEIALVNMYKN